MSAATARLLLQELVQTLGDEGAALASNDVARLSELAQRKQQLILELAPLLRTLNPDQRPLRDLRDAARLNATNGSLLVPRLRATRAGLAALGLDATTSGVYAPTGDVAATTTPRPVRASA